MPTATGPDVLAAAIRELGYDARTPSRDRPDKAVSKRLTRLCVPPGAPKFFVDAIEEAGAAHRPIILDFWAEWCAACLRLKHETLDHPDVARVLSAVEVIYVDLDKYPELGEAYGVAAMPDVFFIDRTGHIVDRLQNFEPPKEFVARVRKILGRTLNRDAGDE